MLIKYDKLPDFMKNKKVKYYYDILSKKIRCPYSSVARAFA